MAWLAEFTHHRYIPGQRDPLSARQKVVAAKKWRAALAKAAIMREIRLIRFQTIVAYIN
jgi:hypothetical protein